MACRPASCLASRHRPKAQRSVLALVADRAGGVCSPRGRFRKLVVALQHARLDMNMSLYRSLAKAAGTREALELAPRLAAWHDAMVLHQRQAGSGRWLCGGDCPHTEPEALWSEALGAYGERAHELRFLRTHGMTSFHETAAATWRWASETDAS